MVEYSDALYSGTRRALADTDINTLAKSAPKLAADGRPTLFIGDLKISQGVDLQGKFTQVIFSSMDSETLVQALGRVGRTGSDGLAAEATRFVVFDKRFAENQIRTALLPDYQAPVMRAIAANAGQDSLGAQLFRDRSNIDAKGLAAAIRPKLRILLILKMRRRGSSQVPTRTSWQDEIACGSGVSYVLAWLL